MRTGRGRGVVRQWLPRCSERSAVASAEHHLKTRIKLGIRTIHSRGVQILVMRKAADWRSWAHHLRGGGGGGLVPFPADTQMSLLATMRRGLSGLYISVLVRLLKSSQLVSGSTSHHVT
jgi:hypothetical protein